MLKMAKTYKLWRFVAFRKTAHRVAAAGLVTGCLEWGLTGKERTRNMWASIESARNMAGIPIFSQGGHEKLTPPQKIALTRENIKKKKLKKNTPKKHKNTATKHKNIPKWRKKHQQKKSRLRAKKNYSPPEINAKPKPGKSA